MRDSYALVLGRVRARKAAEAAARAAAALEDALHPRPAPAQSAPAEGEDLSEGAEDAADPEHVTNVRWGRGLVVPRIVCAAARRALELSVGGARRPRESRPCGGGIVDGSVCSGDGDGVASIGPETIFRC
jgi:hypothetical protein